MFQSEQLTGPNYEVVDDFKFVRYLMLKRGLSEEDACIAAGVSVDGFRGSSFKEAERLVSAGVSVTKACLRVGLQRTLYYRLKKEALAANEGE